MTSCAPADEKTAQQVWRDKETRGGGIPLGLPMPTSLPFDMSMLQDVSTLQVQMLTVSGLTGYTAGFAIKHTMRVFVYTGGCIFMGLQALAQNGLITIHWDEMDRRLKSAVDLDKDGKVSATDLQAASDKLQAYLQAGLPNAGTFSVGFLMGLRS